MTMVKYLFTDVNRGIPSSIGCKQSIFVWIAHFLDVWGGIALTVAVLMFIVFLLAMTYVCCSRDAKYENQPIPVIPIPAQNNNRLNTETNPNAPVLVRPVDNNVAATNPRQGQELRQY